MIARLALIEAGIAFESITVDIHRRKQQLEPAYVRLNPNMTVPTLEVGASIRLDQSRDIVAHAFPEASGDEATRRLLDTHYAFPIEELTFGWLLNWNPLAPRVIPKSLKGVEEKLRVLAAEHPDLADRYLARAEVFAGRVRTFDPENIAALFEARKAEALALLDMLEALVADGRAFLVPSGYGPADVVWTVFLARMRFIHWGREIEKRPALSRYEAAMKARPSFEAADLWTSLHPLRLLWQVL